MRSSIGTRCFLRLGMLSPAVLGLSLPRELSVPKAIMDGLAKLI